MQPDQVWQATLGELQLQLTKSTYDTWLRDTTLLSYDVEAGVFNIGVESADCKTFLENGMLSTIRRTLTGITGKPADVQFVVVEPESADDQRKSLWDDDETDGEVGSNYDWTEFGVPPDYSGAEMADLHLSSEIMRHPGLLSYLNSGRSDLLKQGRGLILTGPTGTGKTTLAVCLLKQLIRGQASSALFVDASGLLNSLLADVRMNTDVGDRLYHRAISADVLVLDDLDMDDLTRWSAGKLDDLIRRRANRRRPLVVTSNHSWDSIRAARSSNERGALDRATISRLFASSVIVNLPPDAADWRIKQRNGVNR